MCSLQTLTTFCRCECSTSSSVTVKCTFSLHFCGNPCEFSCPREHRKLDFHSHGMRGNSVVRAVEQLTAVLSVCVINVQRCRILGRTDAG